MFFVFPFAVYPRQKEERFFKGLYQLGNVLHVVSLVVVVTEFYVRLVTSLPDYFTNTNVTVASGMEIVMRNCQYEGSLQIGGVHATTVVTGDSLAAPLMVVAQHILAIIVVQFLAILNDAFSLANYSAGNRHLRVLGVHVPLYHITTTLSFILCISLIVLVWIIYPSRHFYADALRDCARELEQSNVTALYEAEYDEYNIFLTPIEWSFGAAVANLIFYVAGALVLTVKSHDSAMLLLSESNVPWESRGFMCATDKAALRIHTTARDAILAEAREAIAHGQKVRIARTYALMTEADYEAQVEEMRLRFAERVKEEHYEQMRTHFERESDLEEGGLLWRRHPPPPPPPPPAAAATPMRQQADQFFETKRSGRSGDDGTFNELFNEREYGERMWDEYYDDDDDDKHNNTYVVEADEGGELAEVPPIEAARQHRQHRRRRHHHRHQNTGVDDVSGEPDEAVLHQAEAPYELQGVDADALGDDDGHPGRRHHRRHRHRSRTNTEGDGEMDGQINMPSPLEEADEM